MDPMTCNRLELLPPTARSSKSSFSIRIDINRRQTIDFGNTLCDQVLGPLYSYMTLLGLNHTHHRVRKPALKWPLVVYNYGTFGILIIATIRRFYQLKEYSANSGFSMLNPVFVMLICHALLMFSSAAAMFLLLKFQNRRNQMFVVLGHGIGRHRQLEQDRQHSRTNKFFIPLGLSLTSTLAVIQIAVKLRYLNIPDVPDLIDAYTLSVILEGYVVFIGANSVMMVGMIFYQLCSILHVSISQLIKEMVPDGKDSCPLPEQSLQKIHAVQVYYQEISDAKNFIEQNFSFALFYAYGSCIPFTCFLGFITLQNASQAETAETFSYIFLLISTMFVLLFFSLPAFSIAEEGDKLLTASFKMYHDTLCEEQDSIVMTRMSFLTFQMHATKLTISAANFFQMNRKILISLFSAIFTYFLILVQFEIGSGDCKGKHQALIVQPPL